MSHIDFNHRRRACLLILTSFLISVTANTCSLDTETDMSIDENSQKISNLLYHSGVTSANACDVKCCRMTDDGCNIASFIRNGSTGDCITATCANNHVVDCIVEVTGGQVSSISPIGGHARPSGSQNNAGEAPEQASSTGAPAPAVPDASTAQAPEIVDEHDIGADTDELETTTPYSLYDYEEMGEVDPKAQLVEEIEEEVYLNDLIEEAYEDGLFNETFSDEYDVGSDESAPIPAEDSAYWDEWPPTPISNGGADGSDEPVDTALSAIGPLLNPHNALIAGIVFSVFVLFIILILLLRKLRSSKAHAEYRKLADEFEGLHENEPLYTEDGRSYVD